MPTAAIETILLATDLTDASKEAAIQAEGLARSLGSRLIALNVLELRRLAGFGSHQRVDQARSERERHLSKLVERARHRGVDADFLVWDGDAGSVIIDAAQAEGADLLVVGRRDHGPAGRILLGSVSEHVIRSSTVPVLVVGPRARSEWPPE
jgi:nucleotide-binding universal stress UspA family protein